MGFSQASGEKHEKGVWVIGKKQQGVGHGMDAV